MTFQIEFIFISSISFSLSLILFLSCSFLNFSFPFRIGEHPAAMQHNCQDKQFILQPMMVVLPVATIVAHRAALPTNFTATSLTVIIAAMSSILHEIWIALAQFRKNAFNSMQWPPSASIWVAR